MVQFSGLLLFLEAGITTTTATGHLLAAFVVSTTIWLSRITSFGTVVTATKLQTEIPADATIVERIASFPGFSRGVRDAAAACVRVRRIVEARLVGFTVRIAFGAFTRVTGLDTSEDKAVAVQAFVCVTELTGVEVRAAFSGFARPFTLGVEQLAVAGCNLAAGFNTVGKGWAFGVCGVALLRIAFVQADTTVALVANLCTATASWLWLTGAASRNTSTSIANESRFTA